MGSAKISDAEAFRGCRGMRLGGRGKNRGSWPCVCPPTVGIQTVREVLEVDGLVVLVLLLLAVDIAG